MQPNPKFSQLASDDQINATVKALEANGIKSIVVNNGEEAKKYLFGLIPKGSEVLTMTSMTLEGIDVLPEIDDSDKYVSLRKRLNSINDQKEKRMLGAAPECAVGSVHAVTEDGNILIVSNTGSQLPAYAYAANRVVFVVGAQKIVKDTQEGLKRIYEYSYPLEDQRALKAYGVNSGVNKILIINKENQPDRITVVFVKENLGF